MSEQPPIPPQNPNPSPETPPPPPFGDRREQRRLERMARRENRRLRHAGRPYGWFTGVIILLLGIFFLLQNLGVSTLVNWWAILILIPAFWSFVAAWNAYQDHGKITRGMAFSFTAGVILAILSVVFLFNLSLGIYWPIILIIGGLVLLISVTFPG